MRAIRILSLVVLVVTLLGLVLGTACTGSQGEQGVDGVGIQSVLNNPDGTLTIILTNGQTYTTLNLTGPQGIQGEQGPQGIQGVTGDTGPAGAGVQWKGEWSSSITYIQNDAVAYQGSSYISKQDANTNHVPTDIAWWDLWAEKGDTGAQGIQGIQGPQGEPGGLAWGTAVSYGPYSYNMGSGGGAFSFGTMSAGDRLTFSFTTTGSSIYYWLEDQYGNTILNGMNGYPAASGTGGFIAAMPISYFLCFQSTGSSTISTYYTYYPHL